MKKEEGNEKRTAKKYTKKQHNYEKCDTMETQNKSGASATGCGKSTAWRSSRSSKEDGEKR